jgi:hypothetical protein
VVIPAKISADLLSDNCCKTRSHSLSADPHHMPNTAYKSLTESEYGESQIPVLCPVNMSGVLLQQLPESCALCKLNNKLI